MDFGKALEAMKVGKKVRRLCWLKHDYLVYVSYDNKFHNSFKLVQIINSDITETSFSFSNENILATDWEILYNTPESKLSLQKEVKILKEPLDIIFPSLKIDMTLPPGTIYIKNDISPFSGEIFLGKIDPEMHIIGEFKEWLEFMVRNSENHINNSINNKRYSEVSDYAIELNVYKQCLAKLTKTLE